MTHEEFGKKEWGINMQCRFRYSVQKYAIKGVDFKRDCVLIVLGHKPEWVSCTDIDLVD